MLNRNSGFTLIEMAIIIVIIAILATVAVQQMSSSVDDALYQQTRTEMDQLAHAIVGNPDLYGAGARTDFGYVGDVGALPDSLGALIVNPGGYASWNGPYLLTGTESGAFRLDAWQTAYAFADTLIRSTGSGENLDRVFAASTAALLANSVTGRIVDADNNIPGTIYRDSLSVRLRYPDGTGGWTDAAQTPTASGSFSFSGIPIGNHSLTVIYIPDSDTVAHAVSISPGRDLKASIVFPADLW